MSDQRRKRLDNQRRQARVQNPSLHCPGTALGKGKPSRVWEREFRLDWSTGSPRLIGTWRYNRRIRDAEIKAELKRRVTSALRAMTFLIHHDGGPFIFNFTDSLDQFAKLNSLELGKAKIFLPSVKYGAEQKLEMVLRRFDRTPLSFEPYDDGKEIRKVACVNFAWREILPPYQPPS